MEETGKEVEIKKMKMEEEMEEKKTEKKIGVELDRKLQTASKGIIHAGQGPPPNIARADTLILESTEEKSSDEEKCSDEEKSLKGKRKREGGAMRKIEIADNDTYGWWVMGLDMMEQGLVQQLSGIVLIRKAALIMAEKEDKKKKQEDGEKKKNEDD